MKFKKVIMYETNAPAQVMVGLVKRMKEKHLNTDGIFPVHARIKDYIAIEEWRHTEDVVKLLEIELNQWE